MRDGVTAIPVSCFRPARRSTWTTAPANRSTSRAAIQPRGVLLAVREPDFVVTQVVANVAELRRRGERGRPGRAARRGTRRRAAAAAITQHVATFGDLRDRNPARRRRSTFGGRARRFDAILHRVAGAADRRARGRLRAAPVLVPEHLPGGARLGRGAQPGSHAGRAVRQSTARAVRELTGFDRVMVYRYDEEYNGEVVAEDEARRPQPVPRPALPGLATSRRRRARCTRRTGSG